jgi:hypothetical protein
MKGILSSTILIAILFSNVWAIANAQATDEKTAGKQSQNTNFLAGLSGIQEWASKLEAALRSQGSKIDQRKAKDELLPKVTAIQKSLSDLEDINGRVVKDAGSRIEDLKRTDMEKDLNSLKEKIKEIQLSFRELRSGVQAISLPGMTDIERLGESTIQSRALVVEDSLQMLGYGNGNDDEKGTLKVDYTALKANSDKITALLHQAQDAFGKLHTYLVS